jgi:arginyl-tRNA--protein-N-Asp/Glu arginylyltransferase
MHDSDVSLINQQFFADHVTSHQLDILLEQGWRHFGTHFFRYSYGFYELDVRLVIPLRIRLSNFSLTKSQRRTLNKNSELVSEVRPINITDECEALFARHKQRFKMGVPASIYDFLSHCPDTQPCTARELAVYNVDQRLVAVSYFDLGEQSTSGIYAMFDPEESNRRPGIFTMLKEIEYSIDSGKQFYYQGYAYEGTSFYDYKKQFRGTEAFDWNGNWNSYETQASELNVINEA